MQRSYWDSALSSPVSPEIYDLVLKVLRYRLKLFAVDWIPPFYRMNLVPTIPEEVYHMLCVYCGALGPAVTISDDLKNKLSAPVSKEQVEANVTYMFFSGANFLFNAPAVSFTEVYHLIYWVCGMVTYFRFSPWGDTAMQIVSYLLAAYISKLESLIHQHGGWQAFMATLQGPVGLGTEELFTREALIVFKLENYAAEIFN